MPIDVALDTRASKQFDPNELGEFLDACEERGLEIDINEEDEYTAHSDKDGLLCAYFCSVPSTGPAGGWIAL